MPSGSFRGWARAGVRALDHSLKVYQYTQTLFLGVSTGSIDNLCRTTSALIRLLREYRLTRACRENESRATGVKASNSGHTLGGDPQYVESMTECIARSGSGAEARDAELGKRVGLRGLSP